MIKIDAPLAANDDAHLKNADNLWATYPQYLRDEVGGTAPVSPGRARKEVARSLRTSILTSGENSWNASFFRGLSEDGEARKYLARVSYGGIWVMTV